MLIALAIDGTRGDVHPMLDLGNALQVLGHRVRLCGPSNFASVAAERSIEFREVGCDTREFMEHVARDVRMQGFAMIRAQRKYFEESLGRQFAMLPDATAGADLILGAGVQLAGASAAELHGVPYRYIAYCPVMFPSDDHAPALLPWQSLPRPANRLLWKFTDVVLDPLLAIPINRERRRLGLSRVRSSFRHCLSERPILATDPAIAEAPRASGYAIEGLGCFHARETAPLSEKLEAFLHSGPAPIYFGFGSMTDPNPAATTRMIVDAIEALGCRAILSEGWAGLGEGALPESAIAIGAVPHSSLFSRVAAVVHHGGAGTTTRAAQAGVPQLVIPHLLDQFWWGRRVHELGVAAPPITRRHLDSRSLASTLRALLDTDWPLQRARELALRMQTDPTPLEAARRILAG